MHWKIISLIPNINIKMVLMQGYEKMKNGSKSRKNGMKDEILVTQQVVILKIFFPCLSPISNYFVELKEINNCMKLVVEYVFWVFKLQ
jgi:hypothetical protein